MKFLEPITKHKQPGFILNRFAFCHTFGNIGQTKIITDIQNNFPVSNLLAEANAKGQAKFGVFHFIFEIFRITLAGLCHFDLGSGIKARIRPAKIEGTKEEPSLANEKFNNRGTST